MSKLAIYGAGGHGKVIADAAILSGWNEIHFYDESYPDKNQHEVWPIVGKFDELLVNIKQYDGVVVAIGNNKVRLERHDLISKQGGQMVSIVHPSAVVSPYAKVGSGTVIFAGAIINAFSDIGEAAIINTGATVDHDCFLSNGVHICPGVHIAGNVSVGEASWIGIGSSVIQQVNITKHVMVGAGSVVIKNIDESGTVVGNPAKPLIKS